MFAIILFVLDISLHETQISCRERTAWQWQKYTVMSLICYEIRVVHSTGWELSYIYKALSLCFSSLPCSLCFCSPGLLMSVLAIKLSSLSRPGPSRGLSGGVILYLLGIFPNIFQTEIFPPVVSHHLALALPPGPLPELLPGETLEDDVRLQAVRCGPAREVSAPHHRVKAGGSWPASQCFSQADRVRPSHWSRSIDILRSDWLKL